jgi:hypothetical protein
MQQEDGKGGRQEGFDWGPSAGTALSDELCRVLWLHDSRWRSYNLGMSDQLDPEILEAARKIAAHCRAIGHCGACGHAWTTDEYDPEDDDSMAALVTAARRVIADDEALDRFADDGGLRHALATVISDAAPEKACDH